MALANKGRAREITQIECLNLFWVESSVGQRLRPESTAKSRMSRSGKTERSLSYANYSNRSHTTIKNSAETKFVCTFSPDVRQLF